MVGGTIGGVASVFIVSVDVGIEVVGRSSLVGGTVGLVVGEGSLVRVNGVGWIGFMVGETFASVADVFVLPVDTGRVVVDAGVFVIAVLSESPSPRRRITS